MKQDSQKKSTRRTSKLWLCINTGLAWGVAFYSLSTGQGEMVVTAAFSFIAALYGAYVGVGHLDYRRFLSWPRQQQKEENKWD